jgi:hypothetical protein
VGGRSVGRDGPGPIGTLLPRIRRVTIRFGEPPDLDAVHALSGQPRTDAYNEYNEYAKSA